MKILFLTQICPYPPSNGGAIKTYNTLRHLGEQHQVSLLVFVRTADEVERLQQLRGFCAEIDHCMVHRSGRTDALYALRSMVTGGSFIISRDYRSEMEGTVRARITDFRPDLIYVDHLQMFQFVPHPAPCPVLLDEHNVEWRIIRRFASTGGSPIRRAFAAREWRALRSYELDACARANFITTVTGQDRAVLIDNGVPAAKIEAIPIGVDLQALRPVDLRSDSAKVISFGTMSWPPNVDAIQYFAEAIYPSVRGLVPDVRFTVVGANPPCHITALPSKDPSIEVTGYVDDLRAAAENTAAFVVPLRIGSGMRVKILDAMALGLPIVTTSIGCEGIDIIPGEHALVADTPRDFANAVVTLLRDPAERLRLAASGRFLVETRYSWPTVFSRLDEVLARIPKTKPGTMDYRPETRDHRPQTTDHRP